MSDPSRTIPSNGDRWRLATAGRRLLIVCPGVPHPTEGASAVLFFHYIEAFKNAGFEVLNLLLLQPNNATPEAVAGFEARLGEPGRFEIAACWSPGFIGRAPLGYRIDRSTLGPALQKAVAFGPDVTFCIDLLGAWAVEGLSLPRKLVWLGDLNFVTFWYHARYAWKEGSGGLLSVLKAGVGRFFWRAIYRRVLRGFDRVVVSSKSSEAALQGLGIRSKYLPYPWPERLTEKPPTRPTTPTLLFFGTLQALGSRSAFHHLTDRIYPHLRSRFGAGGFRIKICGRGALTDWAHLALADRPEIEFLGFVPDLDSLMAQCHALLAPIEVPVGNRSRILTAMAHHLPVIAHRNTALGNPGLVNGETAYLAETGQEFVRSVERVVARPEEAQAIADRAYQLYLSQFAPAAATRLMIEEIEGLISRRP